MPNIGFAVYKVCMSRRPAYFRRRPATIQCSRLRVSHTALPVCWQDTCHEDERMVALIAVVVLTTQQASTVADTSPFRALALPTPTPVRSASGAPGPRYWQQRADYTLEATLDTSTNMLRGRGRIYYVNRSPDPLSFVWVQLDQNLFAPGSITAILNQPPLVFAGGVVFDFGGKGFTGGITIDRFSTAGRPLTTNVFGTMMRVELPRPLAPERSIMFDIAWHFPIPPYGGGRMGRVGSKFYELGQWYPLMAVSDDVHGWYA